jgi:hypothetical protein
MPRAGGVWEGEGLQCQQPNPSTSHACGAGPSFSLWEKGFSSGLERTRPYRLRSSVALNWRWRMTPNGSNASLLSAG